MARVGGIMDWVRDGGDGGGDEGGGWGADEMKGVMHGEWVAGRWRWR